MRNEWVFGCALCAVCLQLSAAPKELAWRQAPGFRYLDINPGANSRTGFVQLSSETTGVRFTNLLAQSRSLTNHVLLNGSGVAAGDVDGDGWCDLYFCGLDGANALYRNLGNWRFADITAEAGVACPDVDATGAALVDIDGDGDLDLIVNTIGRGSLLFLNDGTGHFREVTAQSGLTSQSGSMSMALGDVDGDGDLDLYVANYRTWTMRDSFSMRIRVKTVAGKPVVTMVNGRPVTDPDLAGRFSIDASGNIEENGEPDVLYENQGAGRFTARPWIGPTFKDEDGQPLRDAPHDWSLSAMFRDINGDGAPDLYVCGDLGSPDRVWINDGAGNFRALRPLALRKTSWFSMGVDFADLNRDGLDEFMVTDMISRNHVLRQVQVSHHRPVFSPLGEIANRPQIPRNTLFLNMGDGDYSEIAYFSGLDATEWSWTPVFLDVDLDGFEDALIVTGFERDVQDIDVASRLEAVRRQQNVSDAEALRMRRMFPRLDLAKLAFRNRHDLTFQDFSAAWGFNTKAISQGIALADLDNDGDLDVIVNDMNSAAELFRNETSAPRVAVRLRGRPPNTRGIGAKIWVYDGAVPMQSQEMICGGRYLSSDDPVRVFAAGSVTNDLRIEVRWRSGRISHVPHARANRLYEIADEADPVDKESSEARVASPAPRALFEDVSALLNHRHHDELFDDFGRQRLLPKRLSQLGPGVAWADLDGDGWDDLVIGAGKGGRMAVYRNTGDGKFALIDAPPFSQPVTRDQTGLAVFSAAANRTVVVVVGSANYEDGLAAGSSALQFRPGEPRVDDSLPGQDSSTGPLAVADIDGDGDLDLFVGGRVLPGRYPAPASSRLFRNIDGRFEVDAAASHMLEHVGLISGAVFTDLDNDGFPELVLACEWGPIRVFRNQGSGAFHEVTAELGLSKYSGWWNGVTAGDFDGDGRMDLAASNWGQNTKYEPYREQGLRVFYGAFDGSGATELIEAYSDPALGKVVPWQHLGRVGEALPFVRARFSSFAQFGQASVAEILGDRWSKAKELEATWLQSTVFLNRGSRFEARALPQLAQLSPAFALCVGDVDGDGGEDLFLSQNFFATEAETGRYDSGYGLWLRGTGGGDFTPWLPGQSGVKIYGEQRGAALCDYDGDGRLDLVVSQNAAETRLYRNVGGKAGCRVRLVGVAGNPSGIGAVVRLVSEGRPGPAKEIHAGAGYWSQDSSVLVFPEMTAASRLIIRWPGGREVAADVPRHARSVELDTAGRLRVLK